MAEKSDAEHTVHPVLGVGETFHTGDTNGAEAQGQPLRNPTLYKVDSRRRAHGWDDLRRQERERKHVRTPEKPKALPVLSLGMLMAGSTNQLTSKGNQTTGSPHGTFSPKFVIVSNKPFTT